MRTNICEARPGIPFKPNMLPKESEEHAKAISRAAQFDEKERETWKSVM
jgi:hypothetical protein